MVQWISGKVEYTEEEAASALGVSVNELRAMVRTHVTKGEIEGEIPIPTLRPTDLLLLQMLAGEQTVGTNDSV